MPDNLTQTLINLYKVSYGANEYLHKNTVDTFMEKIGFFTDPLICNITLKKDMKKGLDNILSALSDKITIVYMGIILNMLSGSLKNIDKFENEIFNAVNQTLLKDANITQLLTHIRQEAEKDEI